MSIASWIGKRIGLTDGAFWSAWFGTGSDSGKTVTLQSALQLATVWACIRLTAQAVSVLPIAVYQKDGDGGRREASDHPLAELLNLSPNAGQTPTEFWEGMVAWVLAQGNGYAEKRLIGQRVVALDPWPSDQVRPFRDSDGELRYRYSDRGRSEELPADKVFHVRGFGFGGDMGLSTIVYGAQTLGTAMAADESAAKVFANGLQVAGILTSDASLKEEQRKGLKKIMDEYVGSKNAAKLMILEAGLKFQQVTLNPEAAQLLETRRFAIEEICRWFGMPPIVIGHAAQGQTMWGSGVEQILIAWLTLGLNPLLRRIEQRIRKDLIIPAQRSRYYAEFNREALLQADSAAKAAFLSTMVQNGLMDRNEGRAKLNLSKREGADVLTAQSNLAPLDKLGQLAAAGGSGQQARAALRAWLLDEETKNAA